MALDDPWRRERCKVVERDARRPELLDHIHVSLHPHRADARASVVREGVLVRRIEHACVAARQEQQDDLLRPRGARFRVGGDDNVAGAQTCRWAAREPRDARGRDEWWMRHAINMHRAMWIAVATRWIML